MSNLLTSVAPLTDVSGAITYNSIDPNIGITARYSTDGTTAHIVPGSLTGAKFVFDFTYNYGENRPINLGFTGLMPNSSNTILTSQYGGITFANYIISTDNPNYPLIISNDKTIWATPSLKLQNNVKLPYNPHKVFYSNDLGAWILLGESVDTNGSTNYCNFCVSTDGINWGNDGITSIQFPNPYLTTITDVAFDRNGYNGIVVGTGPTYCVSLFMNFNALWSWVPLLNTPFNNTTNIPYKVFRGPSWFIISNQGIYESTNFLDWSLAYGNTRPTEIISLDCDDTGDCLAISNSRIFKRDPLSRTWSIYKTVGQFDPSNIIQFLEIYSNPYGMAGSAPGWLIVAYDAAIQQIVYYYSDSTYTTWTRSLVANDSSINLLQKFLNDPNIGTGQFPNPSALSSWKSVVISDGVVGGNGWSVFGSSGGALYQSSAHNTSAPLLINTQGVTGINLLAVGSFTERQYANAIYDIDTNTVAGYSTLSNATNSTAITIPDVLIGVTSLNGKLQVLQQSDILGVTFGSTSVSSFDLSFNTDNYSPKRITVSSTDGIDYYVFEINGSGATSTPFTFSTNTSRYINSYNNYTISDGLLSSTNSVFESIYKKQIPQLQTIVDSLTKLITLTTPGSTANVFYPSWYEPQNHTNTLYTPIQLNLQNYLGSYDLTYYNKYFNLSGVQPRKGIYDMLSLYEALQGSSGTQYTDLKNEFQFLMNNLRSLEFEDTSEKQFVDGLVTYLTTNNTDATSGDYFAYLNAYLQYFKNNLLKRISNASLKLNINEQLSARPIDLKRNNMTFRSSSNILIEYDGLVLSYTIDNLTFQTYHLYEDKKYYVTLDYYDVPTFNANVDNSIYVNSLPSIPTMGLQNISFTINSFDSQLTNKIKEIFKIHNTTYNTDYLSNILQLGLIPDSDISQLTGTIMSLQGSTNSSVRNDLLSNMTTPIVFDWGTSVVNLPALYYYMSKFITNADVLRRLAYLIVTSTTPDYTEINFGGLIGSTTGVTYGTMWNNSKSVMTSLNNLFKNEIYTSFTNSTLNIYNTSGNTGNTQLLSNDFIAYTNLRYANMQKLINGSLNGGLQDYMDLYTKFYTIIYDYYVDNKYFSSTNLGNPLDSKYNSRFPLIPHRQFMFDIAYPEMNQRVIDDSILSKYFNGKFIIDTNFYLNNLISGSTAYTTTYLNTLKQIQTALINIPSLDPISHRITDSLYSSFLTQSLKDAFGLTGILNSMIMQSDEAYVNAKNFLKNTIQATAITDGITGDYSVSSTFQDNFNNVWNASTGPSGTSGYDALTDKTNLYVSLMNQAMINGGTALYGLENATTYSALLGAYNSYTITPVSNTVVETSLPLTYEQTILPSIKELLKTTFNVVPSNTTYYLTRDQDYLCKAFMTYTEGTTASDYASMTGTTYTPVTTRYIDVNELYVDFAHTYVHLIQGLVDGIFHGSTGIQYDLNLIRSLSPGGTALPGTTGQIMAQFLNVKNNLDAQAKVYQNFFVESDGMPSEFNVWRKYNTVMKDIVDNTTLFSNMQLSIMSNTSLGSTAISKGVNDPFIVNIPPFDINRWAPIGITGNLYTKGYSKYNPNWKYYFGDIVLFDDYGTTGLSAYQLLNADRDYSVKGINPGTPGITGTMSSLLVWQEYHDIPEFSITNAPTTGVEYTGLEKNYVFLYGNGGATSKATGNYDATKVYYKGDQVFYENSIYKCLGSENLYIGAGVGVPPGFGDNTDEYWKIIGTAADQLYEYPSSRGVWYADPLYNQLSSTVKHHAITDVLTEYNPGNPYVKQPDYDNTISYNFGDKVLYNGIIYTYIANSFYITKNGTTGPLIGIDPVDSTNSLGNVLWEACPFIDLSKPENANIQLFDIAEAYAYGELVIYNKIVYRNVLDPMGIPLYNGVSGTVYNKGDVVDYLGYLFSSKVSENLQTPYVPFQISLTESNKYWEYAGETGNTVEYNFNYDYSKDFHILNKGRDIYVKFINKIWKWKYNPLKVNYTTRNQLRFYNTSSLKGIPPPQPEPYNPWVYETKGSGATAYSDNTYYNKGDLVSYNGFVFKSTGNGFGSSFVNKFGDEILNDIYKPLKYTKSGQLIRNGPNYRYLQSTKMIGNYDDNYLLDPSHDDLDYYGTPKWGAEINDTWANTGFYYDLRKKFAAGIELSYVKLKHDINYAALHFGGYTGPSVSLSRILKISRINMTGAKSVLTSNLGLTFTNPLSNTFESDVISKTNSLIDTRFKTAQYYYYSSVLFNLKKHFETLKKYRRYLNTLKTKWRSYITDILEPIYPGYLQYSRYQSGIDGIPIASREVELGDIPSVPKVFVNMSSKEDTMSGLIDTFDHFLTDSSRSILNNSSSRVSLNIGNDITFVTSSTGTSGCYFYGHDGSTSKDSSNRPYYLFSPLFDKAKGNFSYGMFTARHAELRGAYDLYQSRCAMLEKSIKAKLGYDLLISVLPNRLVDKTTGRYADIGYESGLIEYTGTDIDILKPFLTQNDIDLCLTNDIMSTTGTDPASYADISDIPKSNNNGFTEPYLTNGIYTNNFQFDDIEAAYYSILSKGYTGILNDNTHDIRNAIYDSRVNNNKEKAYLDYPQFTDFSTIDTGHWDPSTKQWVRDGNFSGGISAFSGMTGHSLFQRIGAIWVNDSRNNDKARSDDQDEDINKGKYAETAYRIYRGDGVTRSLLSGKDQTAPMQYNKPNLMLVSNSDLLLSQGKLDISENFNFHSILPYVLHMFKYNEIKPSYQTVYNTTLRDIKIKQRQLFSATVKDKATQIVLDILGIYLAIAIIVVSILCPPAGVVLVIVVTVIAVSFTVAGYIAGAIPGGGPYARMFENIASNPFLAFYIPSDISSPENLFARCKYMSAQANLLSSAAQESSGNTATPHGMVSVVSYEQYKYYQKLTNDAEKLMPTLTSTVNRTVPTRDLDYELEMIVSGASEEDIVKTYFAGVTGLTGVTSWDSYVNTINSPSFQGSVAGISIPAYNAFMTNYTTSKVYTQRYENDIRNPGQPRPPLTYRDAIVEISQVQFGGTNLDAETGVYSSATGYVEGAQMYARFDVIDSGEGFLELNENGNPIGVEKTFYQQSFDLIQIPLGVTGVTDIGPIDGVTGTITFPNTLSIASGYSDIESQFGIIGINTIDDIKDLGTKIAFSYNGGLTSAAQDLEGKCFRITRRLMETKFDKAITLNQSTDELNTNFGMGITPDGEIYEEPLEIKELFNLTPYLHDLHDVVDVIKYGSDFLEWLTTENTTSQLQRGIGSRNLLGGLQTTPGDVTQPLPSGLQRGIGSRNLIGSPPPADVPPPPEFVLPKPPPIIEPEIITLVTPPDPLPLPGPVTIQPTIVKPEIGPLPQPPTEPVLTSTTTTFETGNSGNPTEFSAAVIEDTTSFREVSLTNPNCKMSSFASDSLKNRNGGWPPGGTKQVAGTKIEVVQERVDAVANKGGAGSSSQTRNIPGTDKPTQISTDGTAGNRGISSKSLDTMGGGEIGGAEASLPKPLDIKPVIQSEPLPEVNIGEIQEIKAGGPFPTAEVNPEMAIGPLQASETVEAVVEVSAEQAVAATEAATAAVDAAGEAVSVFRVVSDAMEAASGPLAAAALIAGCGTNIAMALLEVAPPITC